MSLKITGGFQPITGALKTGDKPRPFDKYIDQSVSYFDTNNYEGGSTWIDQGPNKVDGTIINTSNTTLPGDYLAHNGSSTLATIPHHSSQVTSSVTFAVWIYMQSQAVNTQYINKGGWDTATGRFLAWDTAFETKSGKGVQSNSTTNGQHEYSSIPLNQWKFLLYTYNNASGFSGYYVNNATIATRNEGVNKLRSGGTGATSLGWSLTGRFGFYAMYDYAMPLADRTELFDKNKARYGL